MTINFISSKYPAGDNTDGHQLYRSLGSFWTQIFQDRDTLQGYTLGMAEELIQSYYKLTEVLQQYSIKDIPLLHKEKWLPLVIKKSEFGKAPLKFEASGAVFGPQPSTDVLYANQLFRFGFPKELGSKAVFSFTPKIPLSGFGAIANKIIGASFVLLPGVDVVLKNSTLYFNLDLFANEYIPRAALINDLGIPETFQDSSGNVIADEFIILWVYQAELDNAEVYNNFGVLFGLNLPTSESYKTLLQAILNVAVAGPTITALNTVFAALADVPVILESRETIEDIYSDTTNTHIITDKNNYRLVLTQELSAVVIIGETLYAGDILSSSVKLVDAVIDPVWWRREIKTSKLGFASHVFAANVNNQLFFQNTLTRVEYTDGKLRFPVLGKSVDVEAFEAYINEPDRPGYVGRRSQLLSKLGIEPHTNGSLTINPVDFVFKNIFKNNTLLLKLDFAAGAPLSRFFALFPMLQKYLPPHVYVITYLNLTLAEDVLTDLNIALNIADYPAQVFSIDGSAAITGARPGDPDTDENYYKDYKNRMFCIATGPYRNPVYPHSPSVNPSVQDLPLHATANLDELHCNTELSGIVAGRLITEIPERVLIPGQGGATKRPSTKDVPAILLIDF